MMFDTALWSDAEFEFPPEELRCHRILMDRRFQDYVFGTSTGLMNTEHPTFADDAKEFDVFL